MGLLNTDLPSGKPPTIIKPKPSISIFYYDITLISNIPFTGCVLVLFNNNANHNNASVVSKFYKCNTSVVLRNPTVSNSYTSIKTLISYVIIRFICATKGFCNPFLFHLYIFHISVRIRNMDSKEERTRVSRCVLAKYERDRRYWYANE